MTRKRVLWRAIPWLKRHKRPSTEELDKLLKSQYLRFYPTREPK